MTKDAAKSANRFWKSCGRGFGGAIIFSFPLLMTMEMWWLGLYIERERLLLFVALLLPLLFGLSRYSGFEPTSSWRDDAVDALVAYAIGAVVSALFLFILAVLWLQMSADELLGKVAVMTVPASMGAVLSSKQLGQQDEQNPSTAGSAGYYAQLFIMAAGALFLCFSVAPTEEMLLIAFMMTPWHALSLALISLVIMDAIVFGLGFRGEVERPPGMSLPLAFLHYSVVGYAIAVLISAWVLWTFGRLDGLGSLPAVMTVVVLALPAALGAAISRLII